MKITSKQSAAPAIDPRAIPLPLLIDDAGLAHRVRVATTAEAAWALLSDVPVDPATRALLSAAAVVACTASDAIGKGIEAFGTLPPDADIPDGWVDRMVELYRDYLAGYWHLDDLAVKGLAVGGWTIATPETLVVAPPQRAAQRARWVAEECPVSRPTLAVDKALHTLDRLAAVDATPLAAVQEAGHALVAAVVRERYGRWQITRKAAADEPPLDQQKRRAGDPELGL